MGSVFWLSFAPGKGAFCEFAKPASRIMEPLRSAILPGMGLNRAVGKL